MNTDNLRNNWKESSDSFTGYDNEHPHLPERTRTSLDNLTNRYRRFFILAAVMIILVPFWISRIIPTEDKLFMLIFFDLYFLTACVIDMWLYWQLRGIDISNMPVEVVIRRTLRCRKVHLRSILLLVPFAFSIVGYLIWMLRDNEYFVYGAITGAVFGMIIGCYALMQFLRDYRTILRDSGERD